MSKPSYEELLEIARAGIEYHASLQMERSFQPPLNPEYPITRALGIRFLDLYSRFPEIRHPDTQSTEMAFKVDNDGSVTVPAGRYFFGDPCYAFSTEQWDLLGDQNGYFSDAPVGR